MCYGVKYKRLKLTEHQKCETLKVNYSCTHSVETTIGLAQGRTQVEGRCGLCPTLFSVFPQVIQQKYYLYIPNLYIIFNKCSILIFSLDPPLALL